MTRDTRSAGLAFLLSLALVAGVSLSARLLYADATPVLADEAPVMTQAQ